MTDENNAVESEKNDVSGNQFCQDCRTKTICRSVESITNQMTGCGSLGFMEICPKCGKVFK